MKKILLVPLIILVVSALIFSGCAAPAPAPEPKPAPAPSPEPKPAPLPTSPTKTIELKFAHQNPPTGRTTVKFLDAWAKKAEEATNGRIKITMYPAQSLCKANESIEATKGGVTDITWIILGYFPGSFPLAEVISLPFLSIPSGKVDGRTLSGGAINSRILQELYETFPEIQAEFADVKLLFLQATDPQNLITTKKPVRNLNDLKGMKIRALGGYPSEMFKMLGASPMLLSTPECYEAAAKGVIDGMRTGWAGIGTHRLYEVFNYWTEIPLLAAEFAVIMNKEKWDTLPPDIQEAIMSVSGIPGAEFAGDSAFGADVKEETLALIQKEGHTMEIIIPDPGEEERWKEIAGKPLWDQWVAERQGKGLPGQKVLDEALRLLAKYR